jgi:hypothetical protein
MVTAMATLLKLLKMRCCLFPIVVYDPFSFFLWLHMAGFLAFVPIPLIPLGAMQYSWVAFCNTNDNTVLCSN